MSLLSDNGIPIDEISRLVGHSSTAVTEVVHRKQIRPVLQSGAVAMNRIFRTWADYPRKPRSPTTSAPADAVSGQARDPFITRFSMVVHRYPPMPPHAGYGRPEPSARSTAVRARPRPLLATALARSRRQPCHPVARGPVPQGRQARGAEASRQPSSPPALGERG